MDTALHYQADTLTVLMRSDEVVTATTTNSIVTLTPTDSNPQDSQQSYLLSGFLYKALDISGDGERLFVLHVAAQSSDHFSILTLDSQAQRLKSHDLVTRLNPQAPVAAHASLVYGRDQWFITFGNEVHLYRAADGAFIQTFDQDGHLPGFSAALSLIDVAVTLDEKMVWADTAQGRIQLFRPATIDLNTKVVIVAGGGPYAGNGLWPTTLSHANEAYRTLIMQGITKDRIRFLADIEQDIDGNGLLDDVHAIASNATVAEALTWANDASELILYMVDHGGIGTFRMQGNEILTAEQLNSQLAALPGKLTMIYDACKSGSFIDVLSGPKRTIITSSQANQDAYFLNNGAISFSGIFWQQVLMGSDLQTAFTTASQILSQMVLSQTPMVNVEGESTDASAMADKYLGVGRQYQHQAPTIISGAATLENDAITIVAEVAAGATAVARVWVYVLNKNTTDSPAVEPRLSLPTVE
ncbi:MAG: C13 family peptidase, partial [Psychrosphaera sp.]|nr:C13 family peptidase [Psychrosphaera sp.]